MDLNEIKNRNSENDLMSGFIRELRLAVGDKKIFHYQTVVLPSIFADFHKMLKNSAAGETVKEEYKMEDGSFSVLLEGKGGKIISAKIKRNSG